ncbi:MAG TPA: DUF1343 domain-containing protein [Chthonomonadaceae bacterium]|nr:DUF1343 domain-containing protein [Chthonomonadaceae bacterium]
MPNLNPVSTGIDALQHAGFSALRGQRIGLITNHTGLDRHGEATIDLLHHAPGVELKALFGPEHGIRGLLDEKVPDGKDAQTGLPFYSLYGERTRPTAEQLEGLDTLVYDIQDVGTRFYTFSSTLGLCMEEAAKHHLRYVVLDRPNPIGGWEIEGPLADTLSFTAYHPVPIRHGLTVGELARLYHAEKGLKNELHIVKVEGWNRGDFWDATNLTWINPSPNMRSLTQALLYPGIGLLEFTNLSVGRGTDTPFEIIGAPWLDGRLLAADLNSRELPGIRFIPVRFTPHASVHANAACGGVNFHILCRNRFVPVLTGLAVAAALHRLFPHDWDPARYDRLLANKPAYDAFLSGATAEALVASWQPQVEAFRNRRKPYLLYDPEAI